MQTYSRLGEILQEIQNSNMSHFNELYNSTKKTVYFELKSVGVPDQNIEDLMQEVYMKLLSRADTINNPQALIKWIKTVSYTSGINYMKSAVNRREYLIDDDGDYIFEDERSLSARISMPEDVMDNRETQRLVRNIINGLPKTQYHIFVAFYYNEQSVKDIASSMNISESAVKTQLFRGRKQVEVEVKALEKKHNTRLYSVAPFTLFLLLFGQDAAACTLPQTTAAIASKITGEVVRGTAINSGASTATVASIQATKVAGVSIKVIIVAISTAVISGAAIGFTMLNILDKPEPIIYEEDEGADNLYEEIVETEESFPIYCDFMDENGFKPEYEILGDVMTFLVTYDFEYDNSVTTFSEEQWDIFCNALLANSWFDPEEMVVDWEHVWSMPPSIGFIQEFCYMVTGHHIPYNTDVFNEKYYDFGTGYYNATSPYLFDYYYDNININQTDSDTWEVTFDFIYAPSSMENVDGIKSVAATIKTHPDGGVDGYGIYALSVKRVKEATTIEE